MMSTKTEESTALEINQVPENSGSVSQYEILQRLAEDNARQTAALEKQLFWTRLQTYCVCGMLALTIIVVFAFIGRINVTLGEIDLVLENVQSVTSSLKTTLDSTDLTGLINDANALIASSEKGITGALGEVEEAVAKIKLIDFEGLNEAISDLQAVVAPLAKLFGK